MIRAFGRATIGARVGCLGLLALGAVLAYGQPAAAETMFHKAENKVPVAITEVVTTSSYTQVRLQVQESRRKVCWNSTGENSPYLYALGRRYPFIDGDNITACPTERDYAAKDTMVLRFEPLESRAGEFALVEGEGGEKQMLDPASAPNRHFWNFTRVKVK
jgi:hypothetical protein